MRWATGTGATGRDDDGGCEVADLNDQEVAEKIHSVQATAGLYM
jgi:hypothetical protein